jgi:hypothetical protein
MLSHIISEKGRVMSTSGTREPGGRDSSKPPSRGKDPHLESLISQWKKGERDKGKKRRDTGKKKK